jgi:hypothetical protein
MPNTSLNLSIVVLTISSVFSIASSTCNVSLTLSTTSSIVSSRAPESNAESTTSAAVSPAIADITLDFFLDASLILVSFLILV